jgi:RND family efflux transporter MFP subunit
MNQSNLLRITSLVLLLGATAPFVIGCENAKATIEVPQDLAVSVNTSVVTLLKTPRRLRLTGTLRGEKETDLAANVAGRLLKTAVERGQSIEEGALLAQVDTRAAQLALQEAHVSVATSEAQEKINESECERYEKLKSAGVVTDLEYDQVTAKCKTAPLNLKAARARQSIAAKNVGDGMIRAPFSGVITERYVEVGEYVQASSRVVSLAKVDELRAVFSVPEKHFPDIKDGAEVLVHVAAYGTESFVGKVAHVSGAVRDTRDIVVEAIIPNKDHRLLPGMFAEVELTIGTENLPSVPKSSSFEQNDKMNVFVVNEKQLEQRVIAISGEIGDRLVVLRGLKEGDKVVEKPDASLKNGARIK